MKTKVLKYAANGNDIVMPYMEVEQFENIENCFVSLKCEEYGSKYFYLIFNCKGVFVADASYREDILKQPNVIEQIKELAKGYENHWQKQMFVNKLQIELNTLIGNDTTEMEAKRTAYLLEKQAKDNEAKAKKEQEAKEAELQRVEKLNQLHEQLKAGEKIAVNYFIELLDFKKVAIHPRTKGLLNDLNNQSMIGVKQANIFAPKAKGKNFQKVFEVAAQLAAV